MIIPFEDLKEGLKVLAHNPKRNMREEGIIVRDVRGHFVLVVNGVNVQKQIPLNLDYQFTIFDDRDIIVMLKRREVNAQRVLFEASGVRTQFGILDSDPKSIERFNILIDAETWFTKDNVAIKLTTIRRKTIQKAFSDHYAKAFNVAQSLKTQLDVCEKPEEYNVEVAWREECAKERSRKDT